MPEQLIMDLPIRSPALRVTEDEIQWLIDILNGRGWMRAKAIEAACGVDERRIRAIARAARPHICSWPGSPGYRLWRDCTGNERLRCIDAFRSQRDDMAASVVIYERAYHGGFRG